MEDFSLSAVFKASKECLLPGVLEGLEEAGEGVEEKCKGVLSPKLRVGDGL